MTFPAIVPKLGFGTWRLYGDECRDSVVDALAMGYRHLDTARRYDNEEAVGRGLALSNVPRDEIFLTTKLDLDCPAHEVLVQTKDSLEKLQTDYLDLLLMHWANTQIPTRDTLEGMMRVRDEGLVRHIGVANFTTRLLAETATEFPIVANQIEYHPYLSQTALLAAAERYGHAIVAYSPVARGRILDDAVIAEIAREHGKTPAQVTLRWCIQQERVCAIPKSASHERRAENMDVFDFELSDDEMGALHGLADGYRIVSPPHAPDWDR
jgi:2,5-diketo-D-gluconate reductase B